MKHRPLAIRAFFAVCGVGGMLAACGGEHLDSAAPSGDKAGGTTGGAMTTSPGASTSGVAGSGGNWTATPSPPVLPDPGTPRPVGGTGTPTADGGAGSGVAGGSGMVGSGGSSGSSASGGGLPGTPLYDTTVRGPSYCASKTVAEVIAAVQAQRPELADIRTLFTKDRAGDGSFIYAFAH